MSNNDKALQKAESSFPEDKLDLIIRTVAKGADADELELFLYTARRMGLDPLARQIHAVKRWDSLAKRQVMAIQVGIDGLRLVADRTGCYAPGKATEFNYDENGDLVSATAYVQKYVQGEWVEFSHTAHFLEYVGTKKDGQPNHMWKTKPHIMLGKCAESGALRKGFPAELSGVYTHEEMEQAGPPIQTIPATEGNIQPRNGSWERLKDTARAAGLKNSTELWDFICDVLPEVERPRSGGAVRKVVNALSTEMYQKLFDAIDAALAVDQPEGESAAAEENDQNNHQGDGYGDDIPF